MKRWLSGLENEISGYDYEESFREAANRMFEERFFKPPRRKPRREKA